MSLIQATRPKRRNYTIALFSTDPNSYQSAMGSPWMADFYVNMNSIMSQEEQARPYFLSFTFQSGGAAAVVMGSPSTSYPLFLVLDFQSNVFPHLYASNSLKPVGLLKWKADQSGAALPYNNYLNATTVDNEAVYINSLLGVNTISLSVRGADGSMFMPVGGIPFTCFITLVPADF